MEIIMFYQDRKFIENKYHKTDEPFNPHARMAYHGYNYDNSTGLEDNEIKDGLTKLYEKTKALPHPVAKANAVKYVLENTKIDINEHDFFVGFWSINRLANCITQNKWEADVYKNIIPEVKEEIELMNASGAVTIHLDFDHVVPDWESIMQLGFCGLLNRVKEYKEAHRQKNTLSDKTAALFDGIIIEYTAIIDLLDRLYKYALTKTHSKAKRIAECLKNIRDGAPQNIYDAMQLIYIYFMLSESFDSYQVRSLGSGLDRTLYSFYCNDLKKGTFSRDDIKELLKYFLMQWQAIGNYWGQPFYLGGTAKDGSCIINDLSNDIIDVYTEMGIYNPKIQIKINTNTPIEFLNKILCAIRKNQGSFVFCCEPGMMRAVMGYGATYEEARTMDIRGCYETGVRANEVCTGVAYINAAKAVEYVFSQGYDKKVGKQVGLKSPPVNEIKSFEEFYSLVLMQWDNLIEISIKSANVFEQYLSEINPSLMYSATIEGSLKKGADAYQCGVKYNNCHVLNCSFATLLDSVTTVYELVYEKKLIALTDLKSALDADWNGYEELHKAAKNCTHKYGNGDDLADMYATAMSDFFCSKINNRPNARGGVYKADMQSALQFTIQGEKTSATPDGRYDGDELSKNASPSIGMDTNGVTALIDSVLKQNPYNYHESHCLDIMLHSSAVQGDDGLAAMRGVLFTYLKNGGMCIQFNVFNADTLRDAQKHPEKYKNLQVRVCGWNVLWNNLSKKEQNAYIKRAENIK